MVAGYSDMTDKEKVRYWEAKEEFYNRQGRQMKKYASKVKYLKRQIESLNRMVFRLTETKGKK